eukprot:5021502-Pyramimonas_sp.AAC.1
MQLDFGQGTDYHLKLVWRKIQPDAVVSNAGVSAVFGGSPYGVAPFEGCADMGVGAARER